MKHNKKRNTAFLYEALVKELTKCIVNKNNDDKNVIVSILKEHFGKTKVLNRELSLYKTIVESRDLKRNIAEKIESGDLDVKLETDRDDEIGDLSRTINEMLKTIKMMLHGEE